MGDRFFERHVGRLGGPGTDALQHRARHEGAAHHEDPGVVEGRDGGRARGGAENGDEAGHPEGDADLARHGVERGARGEALRGERSRGRTAERGEHEPHAGAAEQTAGEVVAGPIGRGADVGDPPQPARREEQRTDGADRAVAEACPEQPAREGGEAGEQRARGDHEPGPQDRLVPHAREEQDAAEHQGAEAAEEGQRAQVGQGHGAVTDHGRLEDRVGVAERAHDEPAARHGGQGEHADDPRAEPAPVRSLDDGGHEAGHRHREQPGTEQVGLVGRRVADLAQHADPEGERQHAEGQVDQEHPAPADLYEEPADRGPEGGSRSADGRPQPDGGTLALGTEGGEEQPQRRGEHECAARRLQDAGGDQEPERRRERTERGGEGEDGQAEEEGLLAPGPVGPAAGRHQRGGEHDRVGAQHPRERAEALPVEAGRDAREGDVDDEEVQRGQEHPRQDDEGGESRSGALVGPGRCRGRERKFCHKTHCNWESCMKQRIRVKCALCWEDAQARLPQPVLPGRVDARGRGRAVDAADHPRHLPGHPALRRHPA